MQSIKTVLWIIKQLNDEGKISLSEIKNENLFKEDMSDRNIARYFSAINEILGTESSKFCTKKGEYYFSPTKKFLQRLIKYYPMKNIANLSWMSHTDFVIYRF